MAEVLVLGEVWFLAVFIPLYSQNLAQVNFQVAYSFEASRFSQLCVETVVALRTRGRLSPDYSVAVVPLQLRPAHFRSQGLALRSVASCFQKAVVSDMFQREAHYRCRLPHIVSRLHLLPGESGGAANKSAGLERTPGSRTREHGLCIDESFLGSNHC